MKEKPFGNKLYVLIANRFVTVITLLLFSVSTVFALPLGQQVVSGQATFNTQGANLTITNSPSAIINWQGFSINANEAVRFAQQNSISAVLNRVIGQDPSLLLGLLQSNGRVFLVNPNGILFGQGARIDVNGFVASTLNISNQDFLAGKYNFTAGSIAGSIENQGTITTPAGGKVYLIAPDIENSGLINAPGGDVVLAAGRSVQLVDALDPDMAVVVSAPADKALNLGQILARSGKVGIYGGLIEQKGVVSANSVVRDETGRIFFKAKNDIILDAGSVTSADGPQGGEIRIQSETGTTLVAGTVTASGHIPSSATAEDSSSAPSLLMEEGQGGGGR
jgi:filamentous hemagglutinin family protein